MFRFFTSIIPRLTASKWVFFAFRSLLRAFFSLPISEALVCTIGLYVFTWYGNADPLE